MSTTFECSEGLRPGQHSRNNLGKTFSSLWDRDEREGGRLSFRGPRLGGGILGPRWPCGCGIRSPWGCPPWGDITAPFAAECFQTAPSWILNCWEMILFLLKGRRSARDQYESLVKRCAQSRKVEIYSQDDHCAAAQHPCDLYVVYVCAGERTRPCSRREPQNVPFPQHHQGPADAGVLCLLDLELVLGRCPRSFQAPLLVEASACEGPALELILS